MAIAATAAFPRCRSELMMARAEALSRLRRSADARVVHAEAQARVERIAGDLARANYVSLHEAWLKLPANRLALMGP
jgi:hypothetical protein